MVRSLGWRLPPERDLQLEVLRLELRQQQHRLMPHREELLGERVVGVKRRSPVSSAFPAVDVRPLGDVPVLDESRRCVCSTQSPVAMCASRWRYDQPGTKTEAPSSRDRRCG